MFAITENDITQKWNVSKYQKPEVTIWCTAFNHAKYISQCLDGFLNQKTNFPFEIIVHDDASTDGTADIIREYATHFPNIIKAVIEKENVFSKGKMAFGMVMVDNLHARYIATCEGDDYWSDENKLQKQYNYMEANRECSMVGHMTKSIDSNNHRICTFINSVPGEYSQKENQEWHLFAHYSSYFYRNIFLQMSKEEIKDFFSVKVPGDRRMPVLLMKYGRLFVLPDEMSVYRYQSCPTSFTCQKENSRIYNKYMETVELQKYVLKLGLNINYAGIQKRIMCTSFGAFIKKGKKDFFKIVHERRNYVSDFFSCIAFLIDKMRKK